MNAALTMRPEGTSPDHDILPAPAMTTAVAFVAQEGRIEFKARLLAATLRHFAPPGLHMMACVPSGTSLSKYGVSVFEQLDVEVVPFDAHLWKTYNYPIGNKLDCALACARRHKGKRIVFIDSDVMAVRPVDFERIGDFDFAAAPIFNPQVFTPEVTPLLNSAIESGMREAQVLPYETPIIAREEVFNSGLVMLRDETVIEKWLQLTELVLKSKLPRKFRNPFADQTSLALLKRVAGVSHQRLPRFWNAHPMKGGEKALLIHYHSLGTALKDQTCLDAVAATVERLTTVADSLFGELSPKDILSFRSRT